MKKLLLLLVSLVTIFIANAQNVGIGTTSPNASALLDLNSTTKGFLLPRVTTTQMFSFVLVQDGYVEVILRRIENREEIDHEFSFIIY